MIDEQADLHPLLRQHRRLSLAQRRLQPRHSRFAAAVAAAQPTPVHAPHPPRSSRSIAPRPNQALRFRVFLLVPPIIKRPAHSPAVMLLRCCLRARALHIPPYLPPYRSSQP